MTNKKGFTLSAGCYTGQDAFSAEVLLSNGNRFFCVDPTGFAGEEHRLLYLP